MHIEVSSSDQNLPAALNDILRDYARSRYTKDKGARTATSGRKNLLNGIMRSKTIKVNKCLLPILISAERNVHLGALEVRSWPI